MKVELNVLYHARSDDYSVCGFNPWSNEVYLYTDRGIVKITKEEELCEYLNTKMLDLKKRKLCKKLLKMECDFD